MAYASSNPPALVAQRVGASSGAIWIYSDADNVNSISANGYFDNATELGMKAGDKIVSIDTGNNTSADLVLESFTNGTADSSTGCNAIEPIGETTIALDANGTGTLVRDDIVYFGTDPLVPYRVTVANSDVSSGTFTITPALAVATAVGTSITVKDDPFRANAGKADVVTTLDEVITLTAGQSGGTFLLNDATEFAVTLPVVTAGLEYTFYVAGAPAGANYTIVSTTNVIQGAVILGGTGATLPASNENTISFVASQALVGDWVTLVSDGTNWYVRGSGASDTGITFTAP